MKNTTLVILVGVTLVAGLSLPAASAQEEGENKGLMASMGRITFNRYCASCHGDKADGTGPVAKMLKIPPMDLRVLTIQNDGEFPVEVITQAIDGRSDVKSHGSRDMPVWGEVFQTPLVANPSAPEESGEDRAQRKVRELVLFLETIQQNPPPPEAETEDR